MALSTRQLWQDSYSLAFFNLQSHHHKGSEKNFDMSFSLQPPGTALCFKKLLQVQQWPSPISHNSTSNVLNSWWGRYAHPEVKTTHHQFQYVSAQCKLEQMKETHVFLHWWKTHSFCKLRDLSLSLSLSDFSLIYRSWIHSESTIVNDKNITCTSGVAVANFAHLNPFSFWW